MKTIGILGGMGSYATIDLFKKIVDAFPAEKEWERPRILIDNNCIMPSRVRAILYDEAVDELIMQMSDSINHLVEAGADIIIIACITAHFFIPRLPHQDKIVNILSLVDKEFKTSEECLILCSEGSIDSQIWDKTLHNVKIGYPNANQLVELREFIEIVKQGNVSEKKREEFGDYINEYSQDTVILGCTELPVIFDGGYVKKRVINPLELVVNYLKEQCV